MRLIRAETHEDVHDGHMSVNRREHQRRATLQNAPVSERTRTQPRSIALSTAPPPRQWRRRQLHARRAAALLPAVPVTRRA